MAIKAIDKHRIHMLFQINQIMEEITVLNRLDHPNIVNYFETYDDKKYLYLVMEYVKGMEMFDKISNKKS